MSQELKAQCEEILAKLVEKYGGQNKRLQSVKYFQEHHVGEAAFLMAACPKAYGKSCTAMLKEREILMILHRVKDDLSPITCKVELDQSTFTIKYQPRQNVEYLVWTVEMLMNGGYSSNKGGVLKCEKPEGVAEFIHNRRVEENAYEKLTMESTAEELPLPEATEKLQAFEDCCLLLLDKEKLKKLAEKAPRKEDGSLHLRLRTPLTWSGFAIDGKAYTLELVAKSEYEMRFEVKKHLCDRRFVEKYKDVPIAVDMLEEFRAL